MVTVFEICRVSWLVRSATYETIRSFSLFERTCASSAGGPGLNLGEQSAGRSIFGTVMSDCAIEEERGRRLKHPKQYSDPLISSPTCLSSCRQTTYLQSPHLVAILLALPPRP